jgi:hypothetical protein
MKICTQCGRANQDKTFKCEGCGVQLSTIPKASFYDKAARYSLVAPFATIVVAFLILWLIEFVSTQFRPTSLGLFRFEHWLSLVGGYIAIGIIYSAFFIQIVSLILGIVSLFGNRRSRDSFWIALLGILASGFFALAIYGLTHMTWSGC